MKKFFCLWSSPSDLIDRAIGLVRSNDQSESSALLCPLSAWSRLVKGFFSLSVCLFVVLTPFSSSSLCLVVICRRHRSSLLLLCFFSLLLLVRTGADQHCLLLSFLAFVKREREEITRTTATSIHYAKSL